MMMTCAGYDAKGKRVLEGGNTFTVEFAGDFPADKTPFAHVQVRLLIAHDTRARPPAHTQTRHTRHTTRRTMAMARTRCRTSPSPRATTRSR